MNERDKQLSQMLKDFVKIVEEDYRKFQDGMNKSLNPAVGTSETRRINSVQFARSQGVEEKCILKTTEETRKRLDEGWKR
jgi:hypothetical protein